MLTTVIFKNTGTHKLRTHVNAPTAGSGRVTTTCPTEQGIGKKTLENTMFFNAKNLRIATYRQEILGDRMCHTQCKESPCTISAQ